MIQLIINLLVPILGGMGVSEADVTNYVTNCSTYIYAILITILVLIAVLILAKFAPKGKKHLVRWSAVLAWVLSLVTIVNLVCYGPLYTNLSVVLNGGGTVTEEAMAASEEVIKTVAEEGMVLVKNDGLLPLSGDTKNLNVFGWASTNPIYGGTGSGSADLSKVTSLLQSLSNAGYSTNEELSQMYVDYAAERPTASILGGNGSFNISLPEPTVDAYTDEIMNNAADFSDTAVIVISRGGGEGYDLPTDMNAVINGTYNTAAEMGAAEAYAYLNIEYSNNGDYDDFEPGETYLELSVTEENMVEKVCSSFDNVIVVINANNTMELSWVDEYDSIGAVILAPGTGINGMEALGEIINGTVNPSGKTADTYVKDLTAAPYFNNIGNFAFNNVSDLQQQIVEVDNAAEGIFSFVNYVEGIYVGYKYYETASDDGVINYEDLVQYPFGYGLSYTTFTQEIANFTDNGDTVSFDVNVTNTGDTAGKDVVEVYFTPPYTDGGIEKASVNLVEFGKTQILEPGASETISFTVNKEDMAAYDSSEIKVAGGGYILEEGEYTISVRSDSHTVLDEASFTVDADIDYSQDGRASDSIAAVNVLEDYAAGNVTYLSRADGFANYDEVTAAPAAEAYEMDEDTKAEVIARSALGYDSTAHDTDAEMAALGADNGLKLADLTGKAYDDPMWDDLLDQMSFDDMSLLVNLGGWQTAEIASVGKIATSDCDGPAGVNNFITQTYGTPYPTETLMSQTWNKELLYEVGLAMGQEYADVNIYGVYGPAMNTHRSAFAGRNFEYYSEDGVLAGYLAAAEVTGLSEKGCYAYIKHFALNDQETNRNSFLLTYSNEQAIREIYLKPFEVCIKNYDGVQSAMMSSFNWIGTKPACGNEDVLTTILRDEWGFVGMVITDYDGSYGYMITDQCVRAGNDLMLGFNYMPTNQLTNTESASLVSALRTSSKNILYTIANSGHYTNATEEGGMSNMNKLFLIIDICTAVVVLAVAAIVFGRYFKKKKAAKKA